MSVGNDAAAMSDGIEIHFDETHGILRLDCEPKAFAPYREMAREQLTDFPEISMEKVVEIDIVDTAAVAARRTDPRRRFWEIIVGGLLFLVVVLAGVGLISIGSWLAT